MKKLTDMQRYINLMQKVNKVMINESVFDTDTTQTLLYSSFEKLANNTLNVTNVNTNVSGEESYVELNCTDDAGNKIGFNFKTITSEGDQDGVFSISDVELINFTFSSSDGTNNIEIDETGLQEFNEKHGNNLAGLVTNYVDVEQEQPDTEDVSLYEEDGIFENAVKRIELIKEGDLSQPQVHYFNKLSPENKQFLIHKAKIAIDEHLSRQGISLPDNEYRQAIKVLAIELHEKMQATLNERRKAWVDGSQAVEVKRECQLGGKGDGTSKACNQGDISNLKFSSLSEKKDDGYPEPIAKEFSGGGDYPKTKKKHRITKKKIKEDNFGTPGYSQIRMPQDNIEEFDDNTADVLLGFEPRNVGESIDYSNEKQLSDFVDRPGNTEIWYFKSGNMKYFIHGYKDMMRWHPEMKPDPNNLEKTHSLVGTIAETDPDRIYNILNNWGGEEVNELLTNKGVSHTSMSVGDIIKIGNRVLFVDKMGFKELNTEPNNVTDTGHGGFGDVSIAENKNEKFTVVFDGTSAYIKEPDEEIDEFTEVIGTYDNMDVAQRVADKYNDKAWGTKMTEEEDFEVNSGDRFEDVEGKQYTVNNKSNDKVRIRRNDGEQQEVVPDALKFTKKLNEQDGEDITLTKELVVDLIFNIAKVKPLVLSIVEEFLGVAEYGTFEDLKGMISNLNPVEIEKLLLEIVDKI